MLTVASVHTLLFDAMSRALILLALNLFSVFNVNHAVDVRPPDRECSGFPDGCSCTTQNISVAGSIETVVDSVNCNSVGLTEIPDFSNHTSLKAM